MSSFAQWNWQRRWRWAAWAAIVAWALLVGRFWHPCYAFTKFIQFDSSDFASAVHEMRDHPIYVYPGYNGYDGYTYTEIAFHPLLRTSELKPALNNVPYRARRILGSALAWLLAGGQPAHIADVYASLNLGIWLILAWLLWRLLAVQDARSWLAWFGLLFSAGALHAVRLALTDLLGVTLIAAGLLLAERRHRRFGWCALAAAGLARETALSGLAGLWRGPWNSPRTLAGNALRSLAAVTPLVAWAAYVRWQAGPAFQGIDNFTWPVVGWIGKWREIALGFTVPDYLWLKLTTLLATLALTVQAGWLVSRFRWGDGWWRIGAIGAAMLACFGPSVWEGHPGAATRLLLPMGLAFAVLAVRLRAPLIWLLAGNLTVFSGVTALWQVPDDPGELAAGRAGAVAYVAHLGTGWFGCEHHGRDTWAWSSGQGEIQLQTWPPAGPAPRVHLELRSLTPRTVEIRQGGALLWSGEVGPQRQPIELHGVRPGVSALSFRTNTAGTPENATPTARSLTFAVYDLRVD
jgi:hypothetical protein